MREQASDAVSSHPDSDTLPPSQPYALPQAYRRLGDDPARSSLTKGPVLEGFPYINASPRIGTTPTVRATSPRLGDTSTAAAAGGRDLQGQYRPGFQRQSTGGLFIEASEPSPPGVGPQQFAGLETETPSGPQAASPTAPSNESPWRGLFSRAEKNDPYWNKEPSTKGSKEKISTGRVFPTAVMSEKETGSGSFDQQESNVRPTRGQKAKRHCARWWWVYLLIFICIVVLVVCLVIFVGVPRIAQSRVNGAQLTVQGIVLSQAQTDNFTMSINSTLKADSSIGAVIDPFDAVMYLEDWPPQTPYARVSFPQTTSASETIVNLTQFTEILDQNAFATFNTWFLNNETLNLSVEGDTHLKVSGISKKWPVHFKKTINIPALNNFKGMSVPESRISLSSDSQGDNFFGTVTIPNESFIEFELGNTSFTNFLLGEENVGTVYVDNMNIAPGINNFSMRANISQTPVLNAIQEQPYCETGILTFQLQGLNVTNHGQYLPYYALALASTNLSVDIDVGSDLSDLGLDIQCSNTTSTKRSTVLW